eukprot:1786391-Rhodomonas_salina.2
MNRYRPSRVLCEAAMCLDPPSATVAVDSTIAAIDTLPQATCTIRSCLVGHRECRVPIQHGAGKNDPGCLVSGTELAYRAASVRF